VATHPVPNTTLFRFSFTLPAPVTLPSSPFPAHPPGSTATATPISTPPVPCTAPPAHASTENLGAVTSG